MRESWLRPTWRKLVLFAVPLVGMALLAVLGSALHAAGAGLGESLQFAPLALAVFSFWVLEAGLGLDLLRSGFFEIPPLWIWGLVLAAWMLLLYLATCAYAEGIRRARAQFTAAALLLLLLESFAVVAVERQWFPSPGYRTALLTEELNTKWREAEQATGRCADRYRFENFEARTHWTTMLWPRRSELDAPPSVAAREGMLVRQPTGRGPNFAGDFTVLTWKPCSDATCEEPSAAWVASAVVDARTGEPVAGPPLISSYGMEYHRDSRLLVVDPPERVPDPDSAEGRRLLGLIARGSTSQVSRYFVLDGHGSLLRVCEQPFYDVIARRD